MGFIVKNTTLPGLLDLLAPHSCRGCGRIGAPLCNRCKNYIISQYPGYADQLSRELTCVLNPHSPADLTVFALSPRDGLIGKLIHDLKYDSVRALARPLAELLDHTLPHFSNPVIIVPLPTISRHIRERGFDHTLLIAKQFAKIRHYQVQPLLTRAKNTVQVGSSREARSRQAATAYQLKSHIHIVPNATYLLLDDVWTTGATMSAAVAQLRSAKPSHLAIAVLAVS